MASAWVLGPERGLDKIEKEEINENFFDEDGPTFQPELPSDPELRSKVRSSGYGSVIPKVAKVVLDDNELRPWEESPTFRPEIPVDPLRETARSSGYGKAIPVKKNKEAPLPSFKIEVQRSKASKEMQKSVRSSGYGRASVTPTRPKSAPPSRKSMTPKMPRSRLRQQVPSSGYGKVLPKTPSRPKTAPSNQFDNTPTKKTNYVSMYTLYKDRPKTADTYEREPENKKPFVLDGVAVAGQAEIGRGDVIGTQILAPSSQTREILKQSAHSSQYGVASPKQAPRPDLPPPEPRLKFDKLSLLDKELEHFPPKTPMADKVNSSGYGSVMPPVEERKSPPAAEPVWKLSFQTKNVIKPVDELELPPRAAILDQVESHKYGKVAPPVADIPEVKLEPLWRPPKFVPEPFPDPPEAPRSILNDSVNSRYGPDYSPPKGTLPDPRAKYYRRGQSQERHVYEEGSEGSEEEEEEVSGEEHEEESEENEEDDD